MKKYLVDYKNENGERIKEKVTGKKLDEIQDKKLKVYMACSLKKEFWEE